MRQYLGFIYILCGYFFLPFARDVVGFLRERNLLRIAIAIFVLAIAASLIRKLIRGGSDRIRATVGVVTFFVVFSALFFSLEIPEERMHLIQYGLLPWVLYASFEGSKTLNLRARHLMVLAVGWAAGFGDEWIQYLLPNRVFEWRDICLNVVGASLGQVAYLMLVDLPAKKISIQH